MSRTLEAQLRTDVRKHGILVWLDLDDHYGNFVDRLIRLRGDGELPYAVHGYRDSFLELLLALEPETSGGDGTPLLVHLPGFTEESVRATPLLELYRTGKRFRKALGTLVGEAATGLVAPERVAAFIGADGLTLAGADAWLEANLQAHSGALADTLRALPLSALMDDLFAVEGISDRINDPDSQAAFWDHIQATTGMTDDWRLAFSPAAGAKRSDVAYMLAGWALCVEYVHDLTRPPLDAGLTPAARLPSRLVETCRQLCLHLRAHHPVFYEGVSEDTAGWLAEEAEQARAEDLGRTDTFRFEEERILTAALDGLAAGRWEQVLGWTEPRVHGGSFWLQREPARIAAWTLVDAGARLGHAIAGAGPSLGPADDLDAAVELYCTRGCRVDQAHRHLEQRRMALLYPQIPEFGIIRARLESVVGLWRDWADAWARDFNALCIRRGFLPESRLQQRTLFREVVEPLAGGTGATALFLVDALRYEMGEELFRLLGETPATRCRLQARLAELPTTTAVGMNALAAVANRSRLKPAIVGGEIVGFVTGELTVSGPEERKRAMQSRVGGSTARWLTLDEVLTRSEASLKKTIARARLVMVSSLEIDEAGENGVGPAFFDQAIQRLRAAWRLLRDAGVRRFVITADHGFLLLDATTTSVQGHGRKIDPKRRHVLSAHAANNGDEVRVSLADLGYEGCDLHLMMPETTALFDRGRRGRGFVHGGNSLQERVIPVLTLEHRAPAGVDTMEYAIRTRVLEGVAGMHCIGIEVVPQAQGALDFGAAPQIELALRVVDAVGVQVDLCQVRGAGRLLGGSLLAPVGQPCELFFRLTGVEDARVLVELHHPTAQANVIPCTIEGRFAVSPSRAATGGESGPDSGATSVATASWLDRFEDVERKVFAHLEAHGVVTESEAVMLLGSQRALRRFSLRFEELARDAPFEVRIEVVAGVKRYVRDGGKP
ncbi:BREX-6 system phosphatase PglZ [Thiocapsa sp.]|uniref:BREX-6 system phosphatase PglZ n=1 Tax=Thiocapsa sp. TaxID=2024551 RepID=UPI0035936809